MRIAFVWDSLREHYGKRFNDGLYLALLHLEEKHTVGYFEPFDDEDIRDFKPDVVLFWGALCGQETPHVKEMPYKKAICFAGGPITWGNHSGFDLYFTESQINDDEFQNFGVPHVRAFGINEQIFKPMKVEKKYDGAIWATFAGWKRHELFAQSLGSKGLAVGQIQPFDRNGYNECVKQGVDVHSEMPKGDMVKLLNESRVAINTAEFWGGGQRMTLEALAMNLPTIVMSDSPKNREYIEECGLGLVVNPEPKEIKEAVEALKHTQSLSREYVLGKWTSKHYATSLEKGLLQL